MDFIEANERMVAGISPIATCRTSDPLVAEEPYDSDEEAHEVDEQTLLELRQIDATLKAIEDEDVYKSEPAPPLVGAPPLPEEYVEPCHDFIEPQELRAVLSAKV